MAKGKTLELVVWRLGAHRYALPLTAVERVLPAAEVTPLPDAPDVVTGILNVQGRIVPLVDLRRRLGQPQRELALADQIVLARSERRVLAFAVDSVQGVVSHEAQAMVDTREASLRAGFVSGVIKLSDGLLLVHDLERLLSLDEERGLDLALARSAPHAGRAV
jgi:purine-binding chemotaxis protein CheW